MLNLFISPVAEAQSAAEAAFDRLGTRLSAYGIPRSAHGMDFVEWATAARDAAPGEFAAFIDACKEVKRLMEEQ